MMGGIISPSQESKNGSRTHVLTDKILKETSSMKKKAKSPSQKRRDQPKSSPLRTTIPWTNHRPPSMTDIPELDCGPACTSVWISARNPEYWAQPLYSKDRNPQADREGYEPDLRPDPDTNHNPRTHTNPDPIPTPAPTPTTTPTLALHLINIKRSLTQSNTNSFCCKGRQGQGWPSVPKHNFSRNYSTQPAFLQV